MLIDTHSHIYAEEFDNDREEVIRRAVEAGVGMMLLPGIDSESYDRQEKLETDHPTLFRQMMGLHPTSVDEDFEEALDEVHRRLFATHGSDISQKDKNTKSGRSAQKYVGVGEIGLDLYWDTTYREQQEVALERQIAWAEELGLPVVLHVRNAYDEVFALLERHGSASYRGIMHCYSGTLEQAHRAVEMGFMLGIGGVLTYKKSLLPEIVKAMPLSALVLETDAPYLAPVPHRGKRNESAYVAIVAQRLAEVLDVSLSKIEEATTENAKRVFDIA